MAWSSPRTWVTAETVTAAHLNQEVRDNFNAMFPDGDDGDSWTPTLEGSVSDESDATVQGVAYQVGAIMHLWVRWVLGSTIPSGTFFVTLPASAAGIAASASGYGGTAIGEFLARDNGTVGNSVAGTVRLQSADEAAFDTGTDGTVTDSVPFTWATGDILSMHVSYPVA